ncbi:hypothetical protein ACFVUS_19300 [Nocardia sp. NPDC058058]|uniref:hypothetical protein n=1 Tax=Nocardia sp. NPDC058058 TaxID=3346317 RepID=UPI0036DDCDC5
MRQRQADSGRIARAAASAGMLALIIVAKAGSMTFGYSFPNSLLILLVIAAIGGAYLLFQRRERPGSSGTNPVPVPAVAQVGDNPRSGAVPPAAHRVTDPSAPPVSVPAGAQRVIGPVAASHAADPAAAVATISAHALHPNYQEPPTMPVHYRTGTAPDDAPTIGLGGSHDDPPTVGLSESAPAR